MGNFEGGKRKNREYLGVIWGKMEEKWEFRGEMGKIETIGGGICGKTKKFGEILRGNGKILGEMGVFRRNMWEFGNIWG